MYFRLSRLRFVLVRGCFLLIILLFTLKFRTFFTNDISLTKNPIEILFWEQLYKQDQLLTNEEKIEQIQFLEKQRKKNHLNWTNIFYDIYQRKIEKMNERDMKNIYKYRSRKNTQNFSQKIFEIFEETPVRNNSPSKTEPFFFFSRFFNVRNFVPPHRYFIQNVRILIVNGLVKILRLIMRIFVEQVFFIMLISIRKTSKQNFNLVHKMIFGFYGLMKLIGN
jgi:hypothetical protein